MQLDEVIGSFPDFAFWNCLNELEFVLTVYWATYNVLPLPGEYCLSRVLVGGFCTKIYVGMTKSVTPMTHLQKRTGLLFRNRGSSLHPVIAWDGTFWCMTHRPPFITKPSLQKVSCFTNVMLASLVLRRNVESDEVMTNNDIKLKSPLTISLPWRAINWTESWETKSSQTLPTRMRTFDVEGES